MQRGTIGNFTILLSASESTTKATFYMQTGTGKTQVAHSESVDLEEISSLSTLVEHLVEVWPRVTAGWIKVYVEQWNRDMATKP